MPCRLRVVGVAVLLVGLSACGGNVVVDRTGSGHGGGGGSGTGGATPTNTTFTVAVGSTAGVGGSGGGCPAGTCTIFPDGPCEVPTGPTGNGCCQCTGSVCSALCQCASPDTPIATPSGERSIASLREGDLVYSVERRQVVVVPIVATHRSAVAPDHRVVRLRLANGGTLDVSRGHPTLDGRSFGDLSAGDTLGGVAILGVELVPYGLDRTYDILPASETGGYFANGALIGSTLKPSARVDP
jgi:hypothetical protein